MDGLQPAGTQARLTAAEYVWPDHAASLCGLAR